MDIKTQLRRNHAAISLSGEMTIYSIADLHQQLTAIDKVYERNLQIDMSQVTEIDTAGVQLILHFCKSLKDGRKLTLEKCSQQITQIFDILGLNQLFNNEVAK